MADKILRDYLTLWAFRNSTKNMIMTYLPVVLILFGSVLLCVALRSAIHICQQQDLSTKGWKVLSTLILFFLITYLGIAYSFFVTEHKDYNHELFISVILFAGSIFVLIVTNMSYNSISKIRELVTKESKLARHDLLTNLPNRILFYEKIDAEIQAEYENNNQCAILLMDLDRFKDINDTLGHHYGDNLLRLVAPRLLGSIRPIDSVCRLGGDEFAVLLPGLNKEQAITTSLNIAKQMEKSFLINGHNLNVGISIGISLYPEHGQSIETLMRCADIAMYVSKRADANYEVYDPEKDKHNIIRLNLVGEILDAITKNQFILYYQPIIDIEKGSIVKVEALIRWQHPINGLIFPDDFIDLAEQSGLIKPLTTWVLETAIEQCAVWLESGIELSVAINLSTINLQDMDLADQIKQMLKKRNVPAHLLIMEITESSMMKNPKKAFDVIQQLDKLGVKLSIDDFGTGYSSLSYLKQMPKGELKIDRTFVMNMFNDDNDAIIVRSTIDLAHNTGRSALAEGVEDQETLNLLEILGCDKAQGYHICRPIPVEDLNNWMLECQWKVQQSPPQKKINYS